MMRMKFKTKFESSEVLILISENITHVCWFNYMVHVDTRIGPDGTILKQLPESGLKFWKIDKNKMKSNWSTKVFSTSSIGLEMTILMESTINIQLSWKPPQYLTFIEVLHTFILICLFHGIYGNYRFLN